MRAKPCRDNMEETYSFSLISHIKNQSFISELGIKKDFCSHLADKANTYLENRIYDQKYLNSFLKEHEEIGRHRRLRKQSKKEPRVNTKITRRIRRY